MTSVGLTLGLCAFVCFVSSGFGVGIEGPLVGAMAYPSTLAACAGKQADLDIDQYWHEAVTSCFFPCSSVDCASSAPMPELLAWVGCVVEGLGILGSPHRSMRMIRNRKNPIEGSQIRTLVPSCSACLGDQGEEHICCASKLVAGTVAADDAMLVERVPPMCRAPLTSMTSGDRHRGKWTSSRAWTIPLVTLGTLGCALGALWG